MDSGCYIPGWVCRSFGVSYGVLQSGCGINPWELVVQIPYYKTQAAGRCQQRLTGAGNG